MPTPSIIVSENPFSDGECIYYSDSDTYSNHESECGSEHESDYGSDYESDNETANSVDWQVGLRSEVKTSSPQPHILRQEMFNKEFTQRDLENMIHKIISSPIQDMWNKRGSIEDLVLFDYLLPKSG